MPSDAVRTLLVIAGEFPPLKTIGRIRTVKFVDHLRAQGWQSVVVTLQPSGQEPNYDQSLLREIPADTPVVRLPLLDFEAKVARGVKRLLGRGNLDSSTHPAATPHSASKAGNHKSTAKPGIVDRGHALLRYLLRNYIDIPDNYWPWARQAVRAGQRLVQEQRIDAIYTTLPPFSSALVGYRLKRRTGLPWIVDYRDLWYGDVLREWLPRWRQRLEFWLERRLLKRADLIITVSEPKTTYMQRLHPDTPARWATLTNGIDVETYQNLERTRPFDTGTVEFVYTGRLFKNRRGYAFAEALGRIARMEPALVAPVRVRILGGVSPEIRERYDQILMQYEIARHFSFEGDVNQRLALEAQVNCDYLLLIVDTGETSDGVIPGKLFEYVAARRPMFALCDPGVTQEIIERSRLGRVVAAEDVDRCEAALREALASPVPQRVDADEAYLAQFDRKAIASRLARLLDEVLVTSSSSAKAAS
ncbi:glycosyltransferase [Candidatus Contendibacter odensensis]|uniref:Glycosyltransferase subfamily 4-like N-terminal domain-containing protein n=1 Tax=Candidatus Contendobacter odensis Run_B_J11 TaxID=1400861 RepID=A0A7U7G7Q5_9GAMM|nr:glycosyltransferase [Candidatus Contendobacter odensis]CDH43055.1 conserved hypothetical protein [Candidatus Contendobacter odensis Run_B_J11]